MESLKLTSDVCRICLEHKEKINWNNKIREFCGISYKDCYYKYTQLVEYDSDCFPTNLCYSCANDLKNAHLFFEKALETHNILQNIFNFKENETENSTSKLLDSSQEIVCESSDGYFFSNENTNIEIDEVICYSPSYESVLEDTETRNNFMQKKRNRTSSNKENFKSFNSLLKQQLIDSVNIDDFKSLETTLELNLQLEIHGSELFKSSDKKNTRQPKLCKSLHHMTKKKPDRNRYATKSDAGQIIQLTGTFQKAQNSNGKLPILKRSSNTKSLRSFATNEKEAYDSSDPSSYVTHSSKSEQKQNEPPYSSLSKQSLIGKDLQDSPAVEEDSSVQSVNSLLKELLGKDVDINDLGGHKPQKPRELLCQYCSLKVNGSHHLRAHEATHLENRERNIVCPICGIKLYTTEALNEHKKIHDRNRQKKYKCEFCEKAFFHRGALNVHRRIHLGLMVKCQLCPKEFFRQIDLERHLPSHSATPLQKNDVRVKKKKYKVQCQYCDKAVLTTGWKAHKALHLNQPQVKCKICNKDYFCRRSCASHIKKAHRKDKREVEENMHYYVDCIGRMSHLRLKQQESLVTLIE